MWPSSPPPHRVFHFTWLMNPKICNLQNTALKHLCPPSHIPLFFGPILTLPYSFDSSIQFERIVSTAGRQTFQICFHSPAYQWPLTSITSGWYFSGLLKVGNSQGESALVQLHCKLILRMYGSIPPLSNTPAPHTDYTMITSVSHSSFVISKYWVAQPFDNYRNADLISAFIM